MAEWLSLYDRVTPDLVPANSSSLWILSLLQVHVMEIGLLPKSVIKFVRAGKLKPLPKNYPRKSDFKVKVPKGLSACGKCESTISWIFPCRSPQCHWILTAMTEVQNMSGECWRKEGVWQPNSVCWMGPLNLRQTGWIDGPSSFQNQLEDCGALGLRMAGLSSEFQVSSPFSWHMFLALARKEPGC